MYDNESVEQTTRKVLRFFASKHTIEQPPTLVHCHRLGKVQAGNPRTVIMQFHSYPDRAMIWNAKKHLKGMKMWLNEDLPVSMENNRRQFQPVLRAARATGQYEKAYLRADRLILDDREYSGPGTAPRTPPPLSPVNPNRRSHNTLLGEIFSVK